MDSKKKMIISISAVALVILAAVVAVVAVLAAQQVTIKSSINVTYTTSEVAGTVTAQYQVANGTATNIGTGTITYKGTETGTPTTDLTGGSALQINTLTSTNKYVDFIFTFTNTGSAEYTATLKTLPTTSNFTIKYTVPNAGGVTKVSDTSFKVAGNTTEAVTYTVSYEIADVSKDATISGTFEWELT